MARKKKVEVEVVDAPIKKTRTKKVKADVPQGDTEIAQLESRPIEQFEINWDKIAQDVREAALMVKSK